MLDAKVKPKRERNMRNNYAGPDSPNYAHLDVTGSTWSFDLDGPTGTNDLRDPASTYQGHRWHTVCVSTGAIEVSLEVEFNEDLPQKVRQILFYGVP
jgi:hypothetical protein